MFRITCFRIVVKYESQIGGLGILVQVDESFIDEYILFGGIDTSSGKFFVNIVDIESERRCFII